MANWPVAGHDWLQGRAGDLQDAWQVCQYFLGFGLGSDLSLCDQRNLYATTCLCLCAQILKTSVEQRSLPSASDLSPSLLLTSFAALLLPQVLFVLASKKGRKFVFDSLETVIASLLVLILLSIVLGLPIGTLSLSAQLTVQGHEPVSHASAQLPAELGDPSPQHIRMKE